MSLRRRKKKTSSKIPLANFLYNKNVKLLDELEKKTFATYVFCLGYKRFCNVLDFSIVTRAYA